MNASRTARFSRGGSDLVDRLEPRRLLAAMFVAPIDTTLPLVGSAGVESIRLADLNGDGKLDFVAMQSPNAGATGGGVVAQQIVVGLGNGNGTFNVASPIGFGTPPSSLSASGNLSVADVTGDGKLDIVGSADTNSAVFLFAGRGDGTFLAAQQVALQSGETPRALVTGDFNNDGRQDIAAALSTPTVAIYFGAGGGNFTSARVPIDADGWRITAGDLDRDGTTDLGVLAQNRWITLRQLNTLSPAMAVSSYTGAFAKDATIGNLRGSSQPPTAAFADYAFSGNTSTVFVHPRWDSGGLLTPISAGGSIETVAIADLNRDGYGELIFGNAIAATVSIVYSKADGTFDPTVQQLAAYGTGLAIGDVNGDGQPDIVSTTGTFATNLRVILQVPESLTVTTAIDEDDGIASPSAGTGVSLREAVSYATRLGGGTVTFAPALGNANAVINLTRGNLLTGVSGFNTTIRNDTGRITINGSGNGGQRFMIFYGNLTVRNLTFTNFNVAGNGGVFWADAFSPGLTIDNCTFTGNTSTGQGSVVFADDLAPVTIRNSTFTGNGGNNVLSLRATSNGSSYVLQHNTIYGNSANGVAALTGNVNLQNNIIANNGTSDVVYAGGGFVGFNNIIRTGGGPVGSLNVDPLLGALSNNGGRTLTMMPAPNSPAINAAAAIGFTVDQRGTARPQGALPDIGAVERAATAAQITAASFESATRQAVNFTFNAEASVSFSRANITLTNRTTNQVSTAGSLAWSAAGTQASLVLTNQLADGNYRLQSGTTTLDFHVLAGDFNRDRAANFDDLLTLAANYDQSGKSNPQGDANYDGTVNFDDLLLLAARYGTSIAAGTPAPIVAPPTPGPGAVGDDDANDAPADVLL